MPFPPVVDNTMRKAFVKCPEYARWAYVEGLQPLETSIDLHAGGCFARGLEVARRTFYEDGAPEIVAIEAGRLALVEAWGEVQPPPKSNKTRANMEGALYYYVSKYPFASDLLKPVRLGDKLGIELTFAFDIGLVHPVTGAVWPYTGRFDMLAEDEHGNIWVVDEKTTGYTEKWGMSSAWANQWSLDAGLTGYCWAASRMLDDAGHPGTVQGAIVRGIGIGAKSYGNMSVMALREPWQVERWHVQARRDFARWAEMERSGQYDLALDHACALYNDPCIYDRLCGARNPERLIENNYAIRFWNPLELAKK